MTKFRNLYKDSLYLQGAKDLLRTLRERCSMNFTGNPRPKQAEVYDKAVLDFLLSSKENLARFMLGDYIRFYNHKNNEKGKLVSVEVRFEGESEESTAQ